MQYDNLASQKLSLGSIWADTLAFRGIGCAVDSSECRVPAKPFLTSVEAVSRSRRNYPETEVGQHRLVLKKGATMFVFILNAIYRQFLKASLSGAKAARDAI